MYINVSGSMTTISITTSNINSVLPLEILYQIFLLVFSQYPRTFPTIASHVCRRWRQSALEFSVLWTRVVFDRKTRSFEREQLWMDRSRDACLDIEITGRPFRQSSLPTLRAILRLIRPHAHRWRSLKVSYVDIPKVIHALADNLRTLRVPKLEIVTMQETSWLEISRWKFRPFDVEGAPKLAELTLKKVPWVVASPIFAHLRKLSLDDNFFNAPQMGAAEIYSILARCPDLEEFVLWSQAAAQTTPSLRLPPVLPSPTLHLGKLRRLHIESSLVLDTLLQTVQLPTLSLFQPKYSMIPQMFPVLCCFNPLRSLTDLRIDGLRHENVANQMEPYLEYLPRLLGVLVSLEQLRFNRYELKDEWVRLLGRCCTRLKVLAFMDCTGVTGDALQAVTEARMANPEMRPLEALWAVECSIPDLGTERQKWLSAHIARVQI
ncbi:hypothetical protein FRB99_008246 [Tulasnella sp. 403]|nr:hypothetical protein FRB99_008246 [Tulasnella sp. 403]